MPKKSAASSSRADAPAHATSTKLQVPTASRLPKDEDEVALESFLFGKKRKRASSPSAGAPASQKRFQIAEDGDSEVDDRMDDVDDAALFTFDSGAGNSSYNEVPSGSESDGQDRTADIPEDRLYMMDEAPARRSRAGGDDQSDEEEEDEDLARSSSDIDNDDSSSRPAWASTSRKTATRKQAAWHDPADDLAQVNVTNDENVKLKKLLRGDKVQVKALASGKGVKLAGADLEGKLREQFHRMHPAPEWASKEARQKSRSASASNLSGRLSELLASTSSLASRSASKGQLPKGTIDIDRVRDANYAMRSAQSENRHVAVGGVTCVRFHPAVNALAVVGSDRRMRMYSIDGHTNPPLLSLAIPPLPLTTAHFHPSGSSVFLAGSRPFYYTYDLPSQKAIRSPKNLFGVADTSSNAEKSFEKTRFSPDGSMMAIAGRKGAVYVLAWGNAGAGQLLATFNRGRSGGVRDLMWMRGGRELWVLGESNEIDVWDVGQRMCVRRWQDQGGFGATCLATSKGEQFCAVGSSNGIVNVYDGTTLSSASAADDDGLGLGIPTIEPKPIRELGNLTTAITTMTFNSDAQILLTASNKKKDAMRLFHLPSATAFTNWPTSSTPLGQVMSADFSSSSQYLTIGNTRGKVLLYSLRHYE